VQPEDNYDTAFEGDDDADAEVDVDFDAEELARGDNPPAGQAPEAVAPVAAAPATSPRPAASRSPSPPIPNPPAFTISPEEQEILLRRRELLRRPPAPTPSPPRSPPRSPPHPQSPNLRYQLDGPYEHEDRDDALAERCGRLEAQLAHLLNTRPPAPEPTRPERFRPDVPLSISNFKEGGSLRFDQWLFKLESWFRTEGLQEPDRKKWYLLGHLDDSLFAQYSQLVDLDYDDVVAELRRALLVNVQEIGAYALFNALRRDPAEDATKWMERVRTTAVRAFPNAPQREFAIVDKLSPRRRAARLGGGVRGAACREGLADARRTFGARAAG
jgi:hypothetical protein